jgi:aryl-alcohol dehydrogenase-like predicted oxidoreductase
VQFGSHYGITNKRGQPSRKECEKIIETALDAGIVYYDTAAYYGDADLILSACLPRDGVKVVSKARTVREAMHSVNLFDDQLYALLGVMWDTIFPKFGKSVYWPDSIDSSLDLVQMPINLADGRNLVLAQWCKDHGIEVHARSVFLQGLLLERGATVRQCLKFVLDQPNVDVALVGANSADELKAIIEAVETLDQESGGVIPHIEHHMLDPRTWGQHAHH